MGKKDFPPFKMKFSIQEEGKEKQIFFTFKEASEKTGLPSKTIVRVLKSGNEKYFRRADKKVFWIQEEDAVPLIQKIFSTPRKFRNDLVYLEQFFSINSERKKLIFWILRRNRMKSLGCLMSWKSF